MDMAGSGATSGEQVQEFSKIITVVRELVDRGDIKVRIFLPAEVDFEFEVGRVEPAVSMSSIDPRRFETVVKGDVADMMSAILSKRRSSYAKFTLEQSEDAAPDKTKFDRESEKKSIEEKMNLVEKHLITPTLLREWAIKRTSKANVFRRLSWEINEKHFDESGIQPERLLYATVRLELQKTPGFDRPIFTLRLFGPETVTTLFDASLEDIKELQHTLAKVQRKMEELQKEKEG